MPRIMFGWITGAASGLRPSASHSLPSQEANTEARADGAQAHGQRGANELEPIAETSVRNRKYEVEHSVLPGRLSVASSRLQTTAR